MLSRRSRRIRQRENKILVLIDWENLMLNSEAPDHESFSISAGFDRIFRQLREIGEIVAIFAFAPLHTLIRQGDTMHEQRFFPVFCPKVTDKLGKERDTTDETIIEFGRKMVPSISGLTHLCIASGDKDFAPLAREAIQKGMKIIIVAGNPRSLSMDLIDLADADPKTKTKMVYTFSPTTTDNPVTA